MLLCFEKTIVKIRRNFENFIDNFESFKENFESYNNIFKTLTKI